MTTIQNMPERASYSLFPPSDEVLQRQQSRRRARGRRSSGSTKRSVSAHSNTSSLFEEQRTSTDSLPASRSTDNLATAGKEERRQSTLRALSSDAPQRTNKVAVPSQLPTIYSPPPDVTTHQPVAPPPTKPLPTAPRPTPTVNTNVGKTLKPITAPKGTKHTRQLTNSTATSTTGPSPISPQSQTSGPSLFTPITPPSAGPSPVKYPHVPRLSSSPAPSVAEQWSPPRRSQSRSTARSQTTTTDLIASYAHMRDGSSGRVPVTGLRRAPSNATSTRTGPSTKTETQRPSISGSRPEAGASTEASRSIFPTYDPQCPPSGQTSKQNNVPQFHLPSQRLESKPYSTRSNTSSLTKEALEAHNAGSIPGEPPKDDKEPVSSKSEPAAGQFPPRSQSLAHHGSNPRSAPSTNGAKQQLPQEFPPPPKREISTKSSKARAVLTKPKPPPKDENSSNLVSSGERSALRREASVAEQKRKKLDFQVAGKGTYTANTSTTTKYDEQQKAVTTTATTTIVNVPAKNGPLHASSDYARIIEGKEFSQEQVDIHHQHSVAVALGAMAFAMGVGVEIVGGAVNGITKGKGKPKKEKGKIAEAA